MKVAVTGKGGVGKTTLAAALARTLARSGRSVVALDADPNPNLGMVLGIAVEEAERVDSVVNFLLRQTGQHSHAHGSEAPVEPDAEQLLDRLAVAAPDGVRLLQTGRIERPSEGCLCCGSHRATRRMFQELSGDGRVIVADLEPGVTDLCWTDPSPMDSVLVVATPDRAALEVARRAIQVTQDLDVGRVVVVANRMTGDEHAKAVRDFFPDREVFEVPDDATLAAAERRGISPLDIGAHSPVLDAVAALVDRLLAPLSLATVAMDRIEFDTAVLVRAAGRASLRPPGRFESRAR